MKKINLRSRMKQLRTVDIFNTENETESDFDQQNSEEEYFSCSSFSDESENENNEDQSENDSTSSELISKDETEWSLISKSSVGRYKAACVMYKTPGPSSFVFDIKKSGWAAVNLFLTDNILAKICKYTNMRSKELKINLNLDIEQLKKFIGLLLARNVFVRTDYSIKKLWNKNNNKEIFGATMGRDKFETIMKCLRFDDKTTRAERIIKGDKFAAISEIWCDVTERFKACFNPSSNITIDEQLFGSKARCPFTQYCKNKPDKFGIKFWMAVDSLTYYILNSIPYLGKDEKRPTGLFVGEYVVMRLMEPYFNSGVNVTTDSFFTSKRLGDFLLGKKITLVGTCNKNRKFIPKICSDKKKLHETLVLHEKNSTLTSYQSKKDVCVNLYSSQHKKVKITATTKKLPETIQYYNQNKYGVDIADKMLKLTTTKVKSKRWPVHAMYNLLDMVFLNSWIIYQKVFDTSVPRHEFLKNLAKEMTGFSGIENLSEHHENLKLDSRTNCRIRLCNNNKTTDLCVVCRKPTCGTCSRKYCLICESKN